MIQTISDKNFAMLIDAENVAASRASAIIEKAAGFGRVTLKRAYTDWTLPHSGEWKKPLLEYAITPVQQFRYTTGKNGTDCAMIVDAMDILYRESYDGFIIVTGDSDFTRLITRLRESGKIVIGIGERQASKTLAAACDVFVYLDDTQNKADIDSKLLEKEHEEPSKPASSGKIAVSPKKRYEPEEVISALVQSVAESKNADSEGFVPLVEVGSSLIKKLPRFDSKKSFGVKLRDFVNRTGRFDIAWRGQGANNPKALYIRDKKAGRITIEPDNQIRRGAMTFIRYKNCTTCKKAEAYLGACEAFYETRDIKESNPSYDELKEWSAVSGLDIKKFFNSSGQAYKALKLKDKLPAMSDDECLRLLATDGMLVKRPLLIGEGFVKVGFKPAEWENVIRPQDIK